MKVGLYFGSFNPIHVGHLILASYFAEYTDLEEVWFVVSPHNPLKEKSSLLHVRQRLEMVNLAIEGDPKLKASDIEVNLPQPNYTTDTLLHFEEKYPKLQPVLLMGSDTVQTLPKWKNYEHLLAHYPIYAYPRPDKPLPEHMRAWPSHLAVDVPLMQLSSSFIREALKERKTVRYMLHPAVYSFIEKWGLYL